MEHTEDIKKLISLIDEGQNVTAIRFLMEKGESSFFEAKEFFEHLMTLRPEKLGDRWLWLKMKGEAVNAAKHLLRSEEYGQADYEWWGNYIASVSSYHSKPANYIVVGVRLYSIERDESGVISYCYKQEKDHNNNDPSALSTLTRDEWFKIVQDSL